jgi:hypothetical protein
LLRGFGRLDFIRPANPLELAQLDLNEGVMIQFHMYDDGQAALQVSGVLPHGCWILELIVQAYRNHDVFKMQSMANMCSPSRTPLVGQSNPEHRQYIETYEVDKRSVFVGNLPAETEELDVHKAFEHFGNLKKITIHKNESTVDGTFSWPSFWIHLTISSYSKALLRFRRVPQRHPSSQCYRAIGKWLPCREMVFWLDE